MDKEQAWREGCVFQEYREFYEETSPAKRAGMLQAQGTGTMRALFDLRHPRRRHPEAEDVYLQVFFDLIQISRDSHASVHRSAKPAVTQLKSVLDRLGASESVLASFENASADLSDQDSSASALTKPAPGRSGAVSYAGIPAASASESSGGSSAADAVRPAGITADSALERSGGASVTGAANATSATSTLSTALPTPATQAAYWELRNALRRFLQVTDTDAYGRRFMGMIRLKKDEQLQHACIEVWNIINGLDILTRGIRLPELLDGAALVREAITDEYNAHDEDAAARLHHITLSMKANNH